MVSQKNVQTVKETSELIRQYPAVGVLDMFKLPASQLHQIRTMLRGKATIRMVKKSLMLRALNESGLKDIKALEERVQGSPALILSEMNPFKLARIVDKNKSKAPAKEGDIAPADIEIKAGPTSLPPGPVIGEFQKAKIPASIEGDKIHVKQDTVVARKGDEISGILADILGKLGVTPMEIGLNLIAVWEDGVVYDKEIIFVPQEKYVDDLKSAHQAAFNLAFNASIPTKETVPLLLSKAHQEAFSLATEAGILTEETVVPLIAKAAAQARALEAKIPESTADKPAQAESPKEEDKPAEKPNEKNNVNEEPEKPKDEEPAEEKPVEEAPKPSGEDKEEPTEETPDEKKEEPKPEKA